MTSEMAQDALDDALATSAATYEISKRRDALILSVKEGHSVIALLDEIFVQAKLDFVPNIQRSLSNATPLLRIGKYTVGPKFLQQHINKHHIYEFSYSTAD